MALSEAEQEVIGRLTRVHPPEACVGRPCVIHNPSDHSMRDLPLHWRGDRALFERICEHGVGHPDPDDLHYHVNVAGDTSAGVHGCDGCCFGSYTHGQLRIEG